MAKKNNNTKSSKNNKGPKGKKARKAAKLERQWGEEVNEEEIKNAKIRKGKHRLIVHDHDDNDDSEGFKSRVKYKRMKIDIGDDNNGNDINDDNDNIQHSSDDDDDDSSSSSIEDEINEETLTYENEYALSSLMKNIHYDKRKKSSRINKKTTITSSSRNNQEETSVESHSDNDDNDDDEIDNLSNQEYDADDDYNGNINNNDDHGEIMDYSTIKPIGENPYHVHFNKEPLPENKNDEISSEVLQMKKVKTDQLNSNLILQLSGKALNDVVQYQDDAQSLSLRAFRHVRKTLLSNWSKLNRRVVHKNIDSEEDITRDNTTMFSSLQESLFGPLSTYSDAMITCTNRKNNHAVNNTITLHVLNHILTANNDITLHNNRIRTLEDKLGKDIDTEEEWRDQGYTRPKVLILLPTRSTACSFVHDVLKLIGTDSTVENLERFNAEFGNLDEAPETDERRKQILDAKGKDWNELFADHVNSDDDFKVGVSFSTKKVKKSKSKDDGLAMKIFSDFYHSDLIIASPLGLKMAITTDNEEDGDADFLSSIEVLVSIRSDVMLMQNWDHVVHLMDRLNQQPKSSTRTDFSRVRNYLLMGQASRWRQFIMVSHFSDPHLVSTFNRHAKSTAGRVKLRRKIPVDDASICNVMAKVRQVFQRVACDSFVNQGDKRIKYFTSVLLPQLLRTKQKHTLFYIPSYFDFVALRNILLKHEIASSHFVSITEYSRGTEVTRGRARFLQGRKRFMLYTGRAHFFMRHHIKGAKHLIMFGLPEHAEFYPELLNMLSWRPKHTEDEEYQLDISTPSSCLNLFTKYEAHNLERIVGSKHSDRMIKGEKNTFLFQS